MVRHQPGKLKQQNKAHKIKGTKRAQQRSLGPGKTAGKVQKNNASQSIKESRAARINQKNQIRKHKREQQWLLKRHGKPGAQLPKVIGIIPLADAGAADRALQLLCEAHGSIPSNSASSTVYHVHDPNYNVSFTYLLAPFESRKDTFASLDVARASDLVLFVLPADDSNDAGFIDKSGREIVNACKALGCPEPVFCVEGMQAGAATAFADHMDVECDSGSPSIRSMSSARSISTSSKGAHTLRKTVQRFVATGLGMPEARICPLHSQCMAAMIRMISVISPKEPSWRTMRSYIVADVCNIHQHEPSGGNNSKGGLCTVQITGYLRGKPMYLHSLMHIVGVGAGRISKVWLCGNHTTSKLCEPGQQDIKYAIRERQEDIRMCADPNALAGEQTWPSEEEMCRVAATENVNFTEAEQRREIASRQLPQGMSEYQADWFTDDHGLVDVRAAIGSDTQNIEDGSHCSGEGEEDMDGSVLTGASDGTYSKRDYQTRFESGVSTKDNLEKSRTTAAEQDAQFPDEMDTPHDVSARVRFARYRALQSFRASPWHPKENLPQEYARIFQFEDFPGIQRRMIAELQTLERIQLNEAAAMHGSNKKIRKKSKLKESVGDDIVYDAEGEPGRACLDAAPDHIASGHFIGIELTEVPLRCAQRFEQFGYLLAFNLMPHEQKLSVINATIQKSSNCDETVKSKDELLLQVGFRSFISRVVFSENNLNSDKHKLERFLQDGTFSMGSFFGPVTIGSSPVLAFKRRAGDARWIAVASGSISSIDPDRIILKKIVLSGYPIRVRKKYAVVKHMFHEPQDVRWFKPAELVTKCGLRGHIKEPVGTHGLFKAHFSDMIKQNDTVLLQLYKRVFPKFPEEFKDSFELIVL